MERMRQNAVERRAAGQAHLRVGFLLMHNFTLTAFSTFVDVLRLAADEGDRSRQIECAWEVMSPGRRSARSSCGVEIQPSADLLDPNNFDYIVVVGGLLQGMPPMSPDLANYLRSAAEAKVSLVGVCTGSFVLCRLDLMARRKCCVSWYHYRDFIEEFPHLTAVADRLFVIDGDRITCSGGTGVADLAAHLVAGRLSRAAAHKALQILLVSHPRTDQSSQPAPQPRTDSDDVRVSRALLLMEQNLSEPLPVRRLAARLSVSIRLLERVFHAQLGLTPQEAYLALRISHAEWMLQNTQFTIARIAAELGFADSGHFGRTFKSRRGLTPGRFRLDAKPGIPSEIGADFAASVAWRRPTEKDPDGDVVRVS